jgi:hypothetical protein
LTAAAGLSDKTVPPRPEPRYVLNVERLDELVAELWQQSGLNPTVFVSEVPPEAQQLLERWNTWRFW